MKKAKDKKDRAHVFDMFKDEWDIFEKTEGISSDDKLPQESLKAEYVFLSQKYRKLLKETMKITRVGDMNYKKLMEANDQIQKQKNELETLNRELREANVVKDKFYSIIAHDLRNPLQFLLLSTGLLDSDFTSMEEGAIRKYIEKIFNTSKNMSGLLENLLEWSQSQYGKIQCRPQTLELSLLARDNTRFFSGNAEKKDIRLFSEIPENSFVYADENMVNSVFRNLVSNAVKFTNPGGEIKITCSEDDEFIQTTVFNTGVAIPQDKIAKFFKISEKYTTTGTANEKGSGLGLILCMEFIEKNGGQIKVKSEENVGNFFEFSLPKKCPSND
ncbi:MAG: HAMP domain-containing histidine kinase [bacterium]|nr:HAMP domain-containing histidine kinase [bacterium]